MAYWFVAILLFYGFATQIHETSCFGNSRSQIFSRKEETNKQNFYSRNLQRNKKFLMHLHTHQNNHFQKTINGNSIFDENKFKVYIPKQNFPENNKIYLSPSFIKEQLFQFELFDKARSNFVLNAYNYKKISKLLLQFTKNLKRFKRSDLIAQVPDDDIEKKRPAHSGGLLDHDAKQVMSAKYFYRNNKKVLVDNNRKENEEYYSQLNKQTEMKIDEEDDEKYYKENWRHQEDALEKSNEEGPAFRNEMTWVNVLRANRGWVPKQQDVKIII